jgi:hypothetical protein
MEFSPINPMDYPPQFADRNKHNVWEWLGEGGISSASVGYEMEDKKWVSPLWSRVFFLNRVEEDVEVDVTDRQTDTHTHKRLHIAFPLLYLPLFPTVRQNRGVHKWNMS